MKRKQRSVGGMLCRKRWKRKDKRCCKQTDGRLEVLVKIAFDSGAAQSTCRASSSAPQLPAFPAPVLHMLSYTVACISAAECMLLVLATFQALATLQTLQFTGHTEVTVKTAAQETSAELCHKSHSHA